MAQLETYEGRSPAFAGPHALKMQASVRLARSCCVKCTDPCALVVAIARPSNIGLGGYKAVQLPLLSQKHGNAGFTACTIPRRSAGKIASRVVTSRIITASATSMSPGPSLVTPDWLHARLNDASMRILDATWYMPNAGKDPKQEFKAGRIPGSRFFDVDGISDPNTDLPHMLPSAGAFAAAADALGISAEDQLADVTLKVVQHQNGVSGTQVVVYDRSGIFSAPRIWWTFRVFGHARVAVLDGGFPAWQAKGYPIDSEAVGDADIESAVHAGRQSSGSPHRYQAKLQGNMLRGVHQMLDNVESRQEQVVDARGAGRFSGSEPEPRQGVRAGHLPHSINVPFTQVLQDGKLHGPEQLAQVFKGAGVDLEKPIVTSCGTGVTASVLALALHQLSPSAQVSVYDGSWTEWGSRQDTPVESSK